MRLLAKAPDGGKNSGVTGHFLIEIKSLFSIVLLHFQEGTREAYHSHAFNAVTVWLTGKVREHVMRIDLGRDEAREFSAGMMKFTPRSLMHKIEALEPTWAVSFRGPWVDRWREFRGGRFITLTHGRKEV